MQRIKIICVGKLSMAFYAAGVAEYSKRLGTLCKFDIVEIAEEMLDEKGVSNALVAAALEREGRKILAAVPKNAQIIALCVEGRQLSSEELASFFADSAVQGAGDIAFIIGSSHGLCPEVKQRASVKLSLSKMTLPHQLARLVLAEQIYRACTINAGIKYHK